MKPGPLTPPGCHSSGMRCAETLVLKGRTSRSRTGGSDSWPAWRYLVPTTFWIPRWLPLILLSREAHLTRGHDIRGPGGAHPGSQVRKYPVVLVVILWQTKLAISCRVWKLGDWSLEEKVGITWAEGQGPGPESEAGPSTGSRWGGGTKLLDGGPRLIKADPRSHPTQRRLRLLEIKQGGVSAGCRRKPAWTPREWSRGFPGWMEIYVPESRILTTTFRAAGDGRIFQKQSRSGPSARSHLDVCELTLSVWEEGCSQPSQVAKSSDRQTRIAQSSHTPKRRCASSHPQPAESNSCLVPQKDVQNPPPWPYKPSQFQLYPRLPQLAQRKAKFSACLTLI